MKSLIVPKNPIHLLRGLGFIEAISFLLLLGVAMPLKYVWHQPDAVKIIGWAHGILFMALLAVLIRCMLVATWSTARAALVFLAALLPGGPFFIDRRVRRWAAEYDVQRLRQP